MKRLICLYISINRIQIIISFTHYVIQALSGVFAYIAKVTNHLLPSWEKLLMRAYELSVLACWCVSLVYIRGECWGTFQIKKPYQGKFSDLVSTNKPQHYTEMVPTLLLCLVQKALATYQFLYHDDDSDANWNWRSSR